jgi:hypothetical protein
VLAEEFFWHGMIKFQKELILAGDFGQKVLAFEFHGCVELELAEPIKAFDTEVFPVGCPTDGSFMPRNSSLTAFDDPFEDSQVFTEPWPKKIPL